MKSESFLSFQLSKNLLRAVDDLGFQEMTAIQAACIPSILAGKDLIAQSKTGSGKTAAFVVPVLQKIQVQEVTPQALILCPTRELCDQVYRECQKLAKYMTPFRAVALIGGQPYAPQTEALVKGVHLIVGTPGRTLEHFNQNKVNLKNLKIVVLDEADRLLEEGFTEEIKALLDQLPKARQTLLFSARFPESIQSLSQQYQENAERITIQDTQATSLKIQQYVYEAEKPEKIQTLIGILKNHPSMCSLIFCRTKSAVNEIGDLLKKLKISSQVLHADLKQIERDRVTALFRNGSLRVLVATDVAARGLDVSILELVINFDLPPSPEIYVHRIGRTGRAGREGTAVSIATAYEKNLVAEIENWLQFPMIRKDLPQNRDEKGFEEFQTTLTKTIQFSGGRSQKFIAEDLMRVLTSGTQALQKEDVFRIEVQDPVTYVAVKPASAEKALHKLRNTKFKGLQLKAQII